MLSITVVINTFNRCDTLQDTLFSLARQSYQNFEIIVVNGPSTDGTDEFLARQSGIKVLKTELRNLSVSRNLGIEASCGDVVAFIDDDAVADTYWLEDLAAAYTDAQTGGAGGLVFDWTGGELQYEYSACYRDGRTDYTVRPPFEAYVQPGCDPFLYLQGTNCSFRREALHKIGGFNEQIEYLHDETDVCMRVIDQGYRLVSLDGATVYHRYAKSPVRSEQRVVFDPYLTVKNQHVFALQNASATYAADDLSKSLEAFTKNIYKTGRWARDAGHFSAEHLTFFNNRIAEGQKKGQQQGLLPRPFRYFETKDTHGFQRFKPAYEGRQFNLCFISAEYPPDDYGGIGRYTKDLAEEAAHQGHSVHVITLGREDYRVDYENGVYVHRIDILPFNEEILAHLPIRHHLAQASSLYQEVMKVHGRHAFDSVIFPLWELQGLACICDDRLPSVMTLMTSFTTIAQINPSLMKEEAAAQVLALEALSMTSVRSVHAISNAILEKSTEDFGKPRQSFVAPLAVRDFRSAYKRSRPADAPVRILCVGRLERRKGIDLLLEAALQILPSHQNVEFVLVGKDTHNTELNGKTYRETFTLDPRSAGIRDRVIFVDRVSEEALQQHYAEADIFCLPSRYESFGLVLLEAMMIDLPLVASGCGGIVEIVQPGKNGLLFEPENIHALTKSLTELISNAPLRREMGRQSRQIAEESFSLSVSIKRLVKQLAKVERLPDSGLPPSAKLAGLLEQACQIDANQAQVVASWVYDQTLTPAGLRSALQKIRYRDDSHFFKTVYRLVLGRKPEHFDQSFRKIIRRTGGRLAFVQRIVHSQEAEKRGIDSSVLSQLTKKNVGDGLWPVLKRRFYHLTGRNT